MASSPWLGSTRLALVASFPLAATATVAAAASACFSGLISKNLSVDGFKIKIGEVHCLVMMLHRPSTKKLKTIVILEKLKIKKAFGFQELGNHFFMLLVGL